MSASWAPKGNLSRSPPRRRPRRSPSPARRRSRDDGYHVIERVIREASSSVQCPMLTRTNYADWAMLMRVNMQASSLWHAVEPEEDNVIEYCEDRLVLAAILTSVPAKMLASLSNKRSAQSAWEAIKSTRVGAQRVREVNAEQLRRQFDDIAFKPGETVDDFTVRITGLANNIRLLGGKCDDSDIVRKMLQGVPEYLEQIACSMETLLDVDSLSVEEVDGRLCAMEQRKKKPATPVRDSAGRLLLTKEEFMARLKLREGDTGQGSSKGGGKRDASKSRGAHGTARTQAVTDGRCRPG